MNLNPILTRALLCLLIEREATMVEGDRIVVQPFVDGQHVHSPMTVPGFDHEQLHAHLVEMIRQGLIEGSDSLMIGIQFDRVTPRGRAYLTS